jgi:hypothetical protein
MRPWSAVKRTANLWLDVLAFGTVLLLAISGAVLHWVLPPGRGRGSALAENLLGWSRHDWRDLHFWGAVVFLFLFAAHLVLHWSWIRVHLLPGRAGSVVPGSQG